MIISPFFIRLGVQPRENPGDFFIFVGEYFFHWELIKEVMCPFAMFCCYFMASLCVVFSCWLIEHSNCCSILQFSRGIWEENRMHQAPTGYARTSSRRFTSSPQVTKSLSLSLSLEVHQRPSGKKVFKLSLSLSFEISCSLQVTKCM